ncbi:MAG: DUF1320 family protein [Elusimicrobiales bacterium]|nr:DUF1320 family protein [Elusimicrobiales bacterium]
MGTNIFSRHINRAEAVINGYISSRYALPLSPIPLSIRTITEDVACYNFIRAVYVQDGERENQYLKAFKDGIEMLKDIQKGKIQLVETDGSLVTPLSSSRYKSSTKDYTPIFDLDDDKNWTLGDTRSEDIADGRG